MYVPAHFKVDDPTKLRDFIERNSFATLVTQTSTGPFATHLPVLIGNSDGAPVRLLCHIARANPQWQQFDGGGELLVIFHGPHAYISPFWYEAEEAVPTWNYAAVHAYGRATLVHDETRVREIVETLTKKYEGERAVALFQKWSEVFVTRMLKGIVAFEIEVTRLEGKFKLGQNRNSTDMLGTYQALKSSSRYEDQALAEFMKQHAIVPNGA